MEISGAPIPPAEKVIGISQLAEGRFSVRINGGPPIPCKPNREIAQATAEGWFEHFVKKMGGGLIGIKAHHLKAVLVFGFVPISYACVFVASVLRGGGRGETAPHSLSLNIRLPCPTLCVFGGYAGSSCACQRHMERKVEGAKRKGV